MNTKNTTTKNTGKGADAPAAPAAVIGLTGAEVANIITLASEVTSVESANAAKLVKAELETLAGRVKAYADLGAALLALPALANDAKIAGTRLHAGFSDPESTLYVADDATRASMPNQSVVTRALQMARQHNADRLRRFKAAGNSGKLEDYATWTTLEVTGKAGSNASTIDVRASLADDADWIESAEGAKPREGAKFGKLVRVAKGARGAGAGDSSNVNPLADIWRMNREKLAEVTKVNTLDQYPAEHLLALARQAFAEYRLRTMTDAPAAPAPLPALA